MKFKYKGFKISGNQKFKNSENQKFKILNSIVNNSKQSKILNLVSSNFQNFSIKYCYN